jgi:hypothetical protein
MGANGSNMVLAGSSIASGINQASAIEARAQFEQTQLELQARMAEFQAEDVLRRGEKEADLFARQARQVAGTQRVGLAAQGIRIDEGTAAEIQEETAEIAAQQMLTIRNNAWRQAWGLEANAASNRFQAEFSRVGARFASGQALMAGLTRGTAIAASSFSSPSQGTIAGGGSTFASNQSSFPSITKG